MKKIFAGIALAAGLVFSAMTLAGGPEPAPPPPPHGFYVGGTMVLPSTFTDSHFDTIFAINFPGRFVSRNYRPGGGIFLGYMFNPHWMLELGANYFANEVYNVSNALSGARVGGARVSRQYLAYLTGLYNVPLTRFLSVYARLGAGYFHKRYTVAVRGFRTQLSTYNTLAFVYGVGLNFAFTPNFGARLEYTGLEAIDHLDRFHYVPNFASFQLYFRF